MKFTMPERAIFSEPNRERVRQVVEGGCDPELLKDVTPALMVIDTTWKCNYDCYGCIDGGAAGRDPDKPDMPYDICMDLVDYAGKNNVRGIMTLGGEAFLYQHIDDFLNGCADRQIPVSIVSNGSMIGEHIDSIRRVLGIQHSKLRISVNADHENYRRHTKSDYELGSILGSIKELTGCGARVMVSTVVFGQEAAAQIPDLMPNIGQLENIAHACSDAGAKELIYIPARHPKDKHMLPLAPHEKETLCAACSGGCLSCMKLTMVPLFDSYDASAEIPQNKDYVPCPSSLLRALLAPDGNVYMCTDHRGEPDGVIGRLKKPGDFKKFWHSAERVRAQMAFDTRKRCPQTCIRYEANLALDSMRRGFEKYGAHNLARYLSVPGEHGFEF